MFKPAKLTPETLEAGYWKAYADFYKWGSILRGASAKTDFKERLRRVAYAGGWKKLEPFWDWAIRAKRVTSLLPMLEAVLTGFGSHPPSTITETTDKRNVQRDRDESPSAVENGSSELPVLQTS